MKASIRVGLVDRSVCHQRREYKSPYDWCQLNIHQESEGREICVGIEWERGCGFTFCNSKKPLVAEIVLMFHEKQVLEERRAKCAKEEGKEMGEELMFWKALENQAGSILAGRPGSKLR